ncbi:protein phosphatase 1 regulatory subunit 12B isoform X1 [Phyllostomus discolor]|uniref:Protein phosphatase 1 regulatory subunit n=1 Tax=Phyllostomus discolor TaxID=89673 RepID=A0A7E6CYF4_9CHIR|nr:protein phosphatase 1 regulatory subunit 12B isoform X1 [Phyllostomus discolor]
MAELEHLGGKRAESARARRAEQLRRWRGSQTEQESAERQARSGRGGPRVRFEDGAVFLAACSSGDTDEVTRLLARGADINTANVDGLTALHQACIDENFDMVRFLVENGAAVDQQDNEGWTPLHAAASCGYLNIAEYFLDHGASVGVVNSEGEVPSDLAEEPAMKDLLLEHVRKQGVDLEQVRKEEEQRMLQDSRQWLNSGKVQDTRQPRSGATALHVAAAKGYSEVLRLLVQAGCDLDVRDHDGWTPLHAAAHWGVKEACSILAEALCNMDARNKLGQTPFDVADEGLVEHLEMLQKKQSVLRSEKEARSALIESGLSGGGLQGGLLQNKEKLLYEEETPKAQDAEEGDKGSSSSSSEEEEEGEDEASESEAEKEADGRPEDVSSLSSPESKGRMEEPVPAPNPSVTPARKPCSVLNKPEEPRDESPSSWRLGLRKTGSHNTLSTATDTREAARDRGSTLCRSASSPRVSALLDNRDKDRDGRSYFSSLAPRRLGSPRDTEEKENRESAANLVRSGSHTRPLRRDDAKGPEAPPQTVAPSTYVSTYLKRVPSKPPADAPSEKADSVSSSTPLCVITNRPLPGSANGLSAATLLSAPSSDSSAAARDRRRSYLTPVRDEEAESLRKARSRQARQTRRSTQGVTLTDLQEAERTFSRSRAERQAQDQPGRKPVGTEGPEGQAERPEPATAAAEEAGEGRQPSGRGLQEEPAPGTPRPAAQPDEPAPAASPSASGPSLYTSSYLLRPGRPSAPDPERPGTEGADPNETGEAGVDDPSAGGLSVRERRRLRERRRGTGISFWTKDDDEADGSEEVREAWHERLSRLESGSSNPTASDSYGDRASARARREAREARLATLTGRGEEGSGRDYKKLYENALTENQKLKSKLQEAQLELADVKARLEKMAQKQEKAPERSSVLEAEKRERRALERKMSEMEEEMKNLHQLKQIQTLKQMNSQLQAENRALARVVARLSASTEAAPPQGP